MKIKSKNFVKIDEVNRLQNILDNSKQYQSMIDNNQFDDLYDSLHDNELIHPAVVTYVLVNSDIDVLRYSTRTHWAMFAFSDIKEIDIPDNIIEGEGSEFASCYDLKRVKLSNSMTMIPHEMFEYCSSLKEIVIPSSIKQIGYQTFNGCASLRRVELPNGLKRIAKSAFWGCSSMRSITLPNTLITIGSCVFGDCDHLKSIIIPSSVKSIYGDAFKYSSLKHIQYDGTKEEFSKIRIIHANGDDSNLIDKIEFLK